MAPIKGNNTMKIQFVILIIYLLIFMGNINLYGQNDSLSNLSSKDVSDTINMKPTDTLSKKQKRKDNKLARKLNLKQNYNRARIKLGYVYANLNTELSFDLANTVFSATLGLEDDLGLPESKYFLTGSFSYFFTPRSGLYMEYYGLKRQQGYQAGKDYIFLEDTIVAGTNGTTYFNTQVLSAGYLLTILRDKEVFLGAYFNIYLMEIGTGIKSNSGDLDTKVDLLAPLPSFGLISSLKLNKHLYLDGSIGFFSLHTNDFGGNIFSLNVSLVFKPSDFLGISLSYQEFDVNVFFQSDNIGTNIDYNFRGPALGIALNF